MKDGEPGMEASAAEGENQVCTSAHACPARVYCLCLGSCSFQICIVKRQCLFRGCAAAARRASCVEAQEQQHLWGTGPRFRLSCLVTYAIQHAPNSIADDLVTQLPAV